MAMSNNEFNSKESSFFQLIGETKIEIPIIQRDYAQGRKSEKRIRNNFLDALLLATKDQNKLELDFVYGSTGTGTLQPLDGQQRLTTLFLLHWYTVCKENKLNNNEDMLKKFTYETRASSRSFCTQLVLNGIDFNNLLPADKDKNNRISNTIKDAPWYFLAWRRDPTITAMLNMLDAIDEKFKNSDPIWEKLVDENRITFQYIELKNFGLSDDLYIKMNARGKPLTTFENFKAKFEQHITLKGWEDDNDKLKFSSNIDTSWTDLFWNHRDSENKIDDAFIKYFAGQAINLYAQNLHIEHDQSAYDATLVQLQKKTSHKVTNDAVNRELIEKRIEKLFNSPNDLEPKDFLQKSDLEYLKDSLVIYSNKASQFDPQNIGNLSLWDYCSNSTLFKEFIKVDGLTTYKQRVLFYAQTAYFLASDHNSISLANWLRVVRNIVQHATIDSAGTFIGAIGLIKELSYGCTDIYEFLASKSIVSKFASSQVNEEVQKSRIIKRDLLNKDTIHSTEDTNFCKGRIDFALYCIDSADDHSEFNPAKLNEVKNVIKEHLDADDITNDFRRALFTIGDNSFYNYWSSWSYNTETVKRCMIENITDLKSFAYRNESRDYLKTLVNKLNEKELKEIIDDFEPLGDTPNWKVRLIKEPKLLDKYNQSRYFGIPHDNNCCYLFLNRKRPTSKSDCHKVK
jgi:hypothetical protein